MATVGVKFKLDLTKYPGLLGDRLAQRVAVEIRKKAKSTVRVDTHELQDNIKSERLAFGKYEVFAEAEHAAAQEWGRPDLPSYGYTPYMRPSAKYVTGSAVFKQLVIEAQAAANEGARL